MGIVCWMQPAIEVEVTRGEVVEAVHTVHAVALSDGAIVAQAGDPHLLTYLRSSAKPLQALPLVRSRPDLEDRLIAIACASHRALPEQLDVVRALLALAPATEEDLETGPAPTRIEHNCSGKHAGFLATCRTQGFETRGYRLPGHPLQAQVLQDVADAADVRADAIPTAVDGCGVPTYALPLERCARLFGALPSLDGGPRVVAAMRAYPELLRGSIAADETVLRRLPDWTGKGGAEGLYCARSDAGLMVAVKVEDGAYRAILPALAWFLEGLGIDTGGLGIVSVENSRGDRVGMVKIRSKSRVPKSRSRV
jgi:L-asparaginase II